MKQCFDCKKDKFETEFDFNRSRADGLQTSCRECNSIRHKAKIDKQFLILAAFSAVKPVLFEGNL